MFFVCKGHFCICYIHSGPTNNGGEGEDDEAAGDAAQAKGPGVHSAEVSCI